MTSRPALDRLDLTIADIGFSLHVAPHLSDALRRQYAGYLGGDPAHTLTVETGEVPGESETGEPSIRTDGPFLVIETPSMIRVTIDTARDCSTVVYRPTYETVGRFAPYNGVQAALRLLVACLLPRRSGLLLHAAAVRLEGRAAVFIGQSDAGKSTIASMFPDAAVLGDELVAVTVSEDAALLHATPFAGTHDTRPARSAAPVAVCFDLVQSPAVRITPLSPAEAMLPFARCVALPRGAHSLERLAFATLGALVERTPCCRLEFGLKPAALQDAVRAALVRL